MDAATNNQNNSLRSDIAARQAIEKNNDGLLAVPRNALDNNTARDTAREDVANFNGIKNEAERFFAALAIGDTAEKQAAYKAELQTINPAIAKETETLRAVITDYERQFERDNRQDGAFSGINAQTKQPELFPYVEPIEKRPLERFELHDPRDDVKYSYTNQTVMEAKAEEIGSTRYYGVTTDDQRVTFEKTEGEWKAQPYGKEADALAQTETFKERIERDTKYRLPTEKMADMAPELRRAFDEMGIDGDTNIEKAATQHIEARNIAYANAVLSAKQEKLDALPKGDIAARLEEMRQPEPGVASAALSKQWADIDAADFLKIQQPERQEYAATLITTNAMSNAEYKAALIANSPNIYKQVSALEASNEEKIALKEVGKDMDARSMAEIEGVPMKSMPGKTMVYNPEPGIAGAEIVNEDGSRITFGGKAAIASFVAENKVSPEDVKILNEMDSLADKYRTPQAAAEQMSIDPAALERVAANRAKDTAAAREALGLNSIEPNTGKEQQQLAGDEEAKRSAWLKKAEEVQAAQPVASEAKTSGNKVESDEIFTATNADIKPIVPPEIEKQYLRVGDKFYHPKNTDLVAFEDKGNRLETKSNSENIAESMVRIASARGWDEIKVSGSETFRKEVWLEAASRGMHVKGYSPSEQDKAELAKRVSETDANKIEKENKTFRAREKDDDKTKDAQPDSQNKQRAKTFANESAVDAVKVYPELAGAVAAVAAMGKKAEADGLTPAQREIVAARVRQNVVNSIERGDIPEVKMKMEIEARKDTNTEKEFSR